MSAIFLVGPSHAGKSTLGETISDKKNYKFHNMDIEAEVRSKTYLDNARVLMKKFVNDNKTHILDFGAGFQNNPESFSLFEKYSEIMITIYEKPEILYEDHKKGDPQLTKKDFWNREYRNDRKKIYRMSRFFLQRTNGKPEEDAKKLLKYVTLILKK